MTQPVTASLASDGVTDAMLSDFDAFLAACWATTDTLDRVVSDD